jgi:hypothetical protein
VTPEEQQIADMRELIPLPSFQRFLWRVIQSAGIFSRTTDGSVDRHLAFDEGRRHLGLDILSMVDSGQPVEHPDKIPVLTLIQVLREEANQQPQEKAHGRRNYDRYDD